MSETIKSYRIRTNIGVDNHLSISTTLLQDYDVFDVLSVKITSEDVYRLHNSNYGVIVGRVLANNGFGVPNAKISVFIPFDGTDDRDIESIYPFSFSTAKDSNGVRYNLLPDEKVADCHQVVGTFPSKRYLLDNDVLLEVFDKYYKYTTRTNNAGDYILVGIPTGSQTLHMDLDLSDCGILSQRPRDFVYKGYTIEQFENPNMFKEGTDYNNLSQVFTQDQAVNVIPFWGNIESGEEIGITRADINVNFRFEPTCVFMGSVASDNSSQGIAKGCVPTPHMGDMDELTTGEGKIEMIRKTPGGAVEEFQIKGTQLIDANGVWCYQIPMNLDYMMTDEYGNMVPTDNPEKGIPTRARVRFRLSMQDNEQNTDNYFRPKVLIPHNPQNNLRDAGHEDYDYEFGSNTREDSFRDLFWNNVYSVKSYIPRFQKRGSSRGWKEDRYTGIKGCNFFGPNNPIPYNNIRIKMPFMFTMMCLLVKTLVLAISIVNSIIGFTGYFLATIADKLGTGVHFGFGTVRFHMSGLFKQAMRYKLIVLEDGLCPDLENWYFAPMSIRKLKRREYRHGDSGLYYNILYQTLNSIVGRETAVEDEDAIDDYGFNVRTPDDVKAIDTENADEEDETTCITVNTDYLMACIEMNLAMEYKVIKFNFYNDWINGLIYIPRFMRYIRPKKKFLGITVARSKVRGCMDDPKIFAKTRKYTQQCAIGYTKDENGIYTKLNTSKKNNQKYHKRSGFMQAGIFGKNGGICHEHMTLKKQFVYYLKPCEWPSESITISENKKINLFATDLILLGSLNDCDFNGLPQSFRYLSSTSYIMPTNLAHTNMETNGPLYATDKGTMCMGSGVTTDPTIIQTENYTLEKVQKDLFPSVKDLSSGMTSALTQELLYLSSSTSPNDKVEFEPGELVDYIPMTIAAGIAWNYTGPGQGKKNVDKLYLPGGHFLGISCKNSQTNMKSCLNLERICEIGATMSQRKEDVVYFTGDTLTYAYTSPTGFISGEEIINTDFRTMFATMNNGRLIANKINPDTGYRVYDFCYYRPSNFNGAFKDIVAEANEYNTHVIVPDESGKLKELFSEVANSGSARPDYDINESVRAQTRTRESASLDYYLFRFGLPASGYNTSYSQERKFLKKSKTDYYYYLPQYENSLYFYFGMRAGATAIDEFNKQFFSECEKTTLIGDQAGVTLAQDVQACEGTGTITATTQNLMAPYMSVLLTYIDRNGVETTTNYTGQFKNDIQFSITGLTLGDYKLTITDSEGVEVSKSIRVGDGFTKFDREVFDFNVGEPEGLPLAPYRGGFIEVANLELTGLTEDLSICILEVYDSEDNFVYSANTTIGGDYVQLYVNTEGTYILKVRYKCAGSTGADNLIDLTEFTVTGPAALDLRIGNTATYNYSVSIKGKNVYSGTTSWYENIGDPNSPEAWLYRICFFNEINNAENGTKTFSNRVYAVNGEKALFGTPQNSAGVSDSGGSWTAMPGYSLDDDASYYSTYGVSVPDITNYAATVVDGDFLMGRNYGYISGSSTFVTDDDKKHYKKGYGFVYRPLTMKGMPEGDIVFDIYDGTTNSFTKYAGEGKSGLFFPTIIYPVMARPFYADMNYFIWHNLDVRITSDGYNTSIEEINTVSGSVVEGKIYNGITFENKFSSASTINDVNQNITVSQIDTTGLSATGSTPRVTELRKIIGSGNEDVSGGSYRFTEGSANEPGCVLMVHTISDSMAYNFHDNFTYMMNDIGKVTVRAYDTAASSDPTITYYLCSQGGDNNVKLFETKGYVHYIHTYKVDGMPISDMYIYCRFSSSQADSIVAKVYQGVNVGEYKCEYNGNVITLPNTPPIIDLDENSVEAVGQNIIAATTDIIPVKIHEMTLNPTIDGVSATCESAINACIVEEWVPGRTSTNKFNEEDFFIVGIYSQNPEDNPDGTTRAYKIYPYAIKTTTPIN